ncbi:P-loop containing nucleoside triphosphate hydrolase protein, partial [Spinellus fusiger]
MRPEMKYNSYILWKKGFENGFLDPEVDDAGNIEYKTKLVNPTAERLEHLVTQLKWRIGEGNGEALYEIGVSDNGTCVGLSEDEMAQSLDTLKKMAATLKADIFVVRLINLEDSVFSIHSLPGYKVAEVLVKMGISVKSKESSDIRVAILGGVGAGKSTLLGRIAYGERDNGCGAARMSLLRHRHEIVTGNTSSITREIIGYDTEGNLINYATMHISTWEQISELSSNVVTLLDTCGHAKYLKTTISGLTGCAPDYACLVISGNAGDLSEMTREHLLLAVLLEIPVFVAITKTDIATTNQLKGTLNSLFEFLKTPSVGKTPLILNNKADIVGYTSDPQCINSKIPVILVSNVSDTNINQLEQFFCHLPKHLKYSGELAKEPVEFHIETVYSLPDVGTVIGGVLQKGYIDIRSHTSPKLYSVGPNAQGEFVNVIISSMHRHRIPTQYSQCGQITTLAIYAPDIKNLHIRKGMFLLGMEAPECYIEFEAELTVLYHPTYISNGAHGTLHLGSLRQLACILSTSNISQAHKSISSSSTTTTSDTSEPLTHTKLENQPSDSNVLSSGRKGTCIIRFMNEPQYLSRGMRFLFIDGKIKCLGKVTRLSKRETNRENENICRLNTTITVYPSQISNKG